MLSTDPQAMNEYTGKILPILDGLTILEGERVLEAAKKQLSKYAVISSNVTIEGEHDYL
jgi:hypothetical protein